MRPKIELKPNRTDKILEILGWLLLVLTWILTIKNYSKLPQTIATHYNIAGKANDFGGKGSILTLPLIATVLYIGLTILNNYPHIFNYSREITKYNAFQQYTNATRVVRYLKLVVVFIFGLITFQIIRNAKGEIEELGTWFLPLIAGLMLIPFVYLIIDFFRTQRK